jgi:transcriptional regulator with XRE-family HTH domain
VEADRRLELAEDVAQSALDRAGDAILELAVVGVAVLDPALELGSVDEPGLAVARARDDPSLQPGVDGGHRDAEPLGHLWDGDPPGLLLAHVRPPSGDFDGYAAHKCDGRNIGQKKRCGLFPQLRKGASCSRCDLLAYRLGPVLGQHPGGSRYAEPAGELDVTFAKSLLAFDELVENHRRSPPVYTIVTQCSERNKHRGGYSLFTDQMSGRAPVLLWCHPTNEAPVRETVGDMIRRLRDEKGLRQEELARDASVSRSWLAKVETGKTLRPEHDYLVRVAAALGVPANRLLEAAGYQIEQRRTPPVEPPIGESAPLIREIDRDPYIDPDLRQLLRRIVLDAHRKRMEEEGRKKSEDS